MDLPAPDAVLVGIDAGTSGVRLVALDQDQHLLGQVAQPFPGSVRAGPCVTQRPGDWWTALDAALHELFRRVPRAPAMALAVAGTSATCLLCDPHGTPRTNALMYDDARATTEAAWLRQQGGDATPAADPRSSLSKLLWWHHQGLMMPGDRILHQADWLAGCLLGRFETSDYNNALKLGFDPDSGHWPDWLARLPLDPHSLPAVVAPGRPLGPVTESLRRRFHLPPNTLVVSGTTDSIAALLAAGATGVGDAVTSIGSTLALKLVSPVAVCAPRHGIYSHRLGPVWLAGGASNTGGAALAQHFTAAAMEELSRRVDPGRPTGLRYYPLPGVGERFPVSDPDKRPLLTPRPDDPAVFFQGMLEALAEIEAQGYGLLAQLGAGPVKALWSSGRVGRNPALLEIRARRLGLPIRQPRFEEPAAGAALLAGCAFPQLFQENLWHSSPILARLSLP